MQSGDGTQGIIFTSADDMRGENSVKQYSFAVQLVQMRVEDSTIFICYATCANDIKLVQMRGKTQYNIHLLCNSVQ